MEIFNEIEDCRQMYGFDMGVEWGIQKICISSECVNKNDEYSH